MKRPIFVIFPDQVYGKADQWNLKNEKNDYPYIGLKYARLSQKICE